MALSLGHIKMNRFRSVINEVESDQTDDDYLQKMNEDVRKKVIEYFNSELKTLNYEELESLATVVHEKQNFIKSLFNSCTSSCESSGLKDIY